MVQTTLQYSRFFLSFRSFINLAAATYALVKICLRLSRASLTCNADASSSSSRYRSGFLRLALGEGERDITRVLRQKMHLTTDCAAWSALRGARSVERGACSTQRGVRSTRHTCILNRVVTFFFSFLACFL